MEAAERVFEAIETYRNELRTQVKALESKLRELEASVPVAKIEADRELSKLKASLADEKAKLQAEVEPLRETRRMLQKQVDDARAAMETFLSQRGSIIEAKLAEKNLALNGATKALEIAQERLASITAAILKAKDDVGKL